MALHGSLAAIFRSKILCLWNWKADNNGWSQCVGRCHANTLQLNTHALAPAARSPTTLWSSLGRINPFGFWDGSWLLQRGTQSCKPGERDKWFMLGRLAKGWIHQTAGFLETQLLSPSILEELSTALLELQSSNGTQERRIFLCLPKSPFQQGSGDGENEHFFTVGACPCPGPFQQLSAQMELHPSFPQSKELWEMPHVPPGFSAGLSPSSVCLLGFFLNRSLLP